MFGEGKVKPCYWTGRLRPVTGIPLGKARWQTAGAPAGQPHVPATAIADLVRAMPALPDADIAALGRIEQSKAASFRCQAAILRIAIQATARCRTNGRG
jgi:hypothetical protein